MMQTFDPAGPRWTDRNPRFWLEANASGNCSVVIRTPWGAAVYLYWHDNPAGPILYGPVGYSDGQKVRKLYRDLPLAGVQA